MQQRRTMDKIPLQANFYPMAAASYLEDDINRVTVLSGQALGVASLQTGEMNYKLLQTGEISKI